MHAGAALGLLAATAAAVVISSRGQKAAEQGGAPQPSAPPQTSILELLGMDTVLSAPRGIRNNNPLNIELGEPWYGLAPEQTDGRFAQFTDPRYGFRAAAKILQSYNRRGVNTLRGIIATWAPSHENNVEAYVDSVAARSGLSSLQVIGRDEYPALFEAMAYHENGQQPYSLELIAEGVSWA